MERLGEPHESHGNEYYTLPDPEDFFTIFDQRADLYFEDYKAGEWIRDFRIESNGRLDMEATAANIGVPLFHEMPIFQGERVIADGIIIGLSTDFEYAQLRIHVNPRLEPPKRLLTFGHEVGHLFLDQVAGYKHKAGRDEVAEQFCEFFGREMVLPKEALKNFDAFDPNVVPELMARYGADHQTVIFQLMIAGKLPKRILIDSAIGEVPNPFYSGKVGRHLICLDCEMGARHTAPNTQAEIPIIDFTAHEWNGSTSFNKCHTALLGDRIKNHVDLNKHYGRWTGGDEALIEKEIERPEELRDALRGYRHETEGERWDIPF